VKSIEINLSSSPYRNDTPLWVALLSLAGLAIGFTAYNSWGFATAKETTDRLNAELTGHRQNMERIKQESEQITKQLSTIDRDLYATQVEFVNEILSQRNFSWTEMFNALEDVVPWSVRLTSVRPLFEGDRVAIQVSGVANNFQALLSLQEQVEGYPQFENVTPGDFSRAEAGDSIFFNLAFNYRPEAVELLEPEPQLRTAAGDAAAGQGADGDAAIGEEFEAATERADANESTPLGATEQTGNRAPAGRAATNPGGAMGATAMRPGAALAPRGRAGSATPTQAEEQLEPESTFGGELMDSLGGSTRSNAGALEDGDERALRTKRRRNRDAPAPLESDEDPDDTANRDGSMFDPNRYVTYDENGKPRLNPLTKENKPKPPPPSDGGGGQ
jgi:Tfp pilus assembly protein PilN